LANSFYYSVALNQSNLVEVRMEDNSRCSWFENSPWVELIDITQRLEVERIFPGLRRVALDLGAGDGGFALAYALRYPDTGILAVERLLGRARKIARGVSRLGLQNVRVLRLESFYTVKYLLPPESVDEIHIMHPDPWPKRRHHKYRIFSEEFLQCCYNVLRPKGFIRLTTDHTGFLAHALREAARCEGLVMTPWVPDENYPQSDFERNFRKNLKLVFRQQWKKIS